MTFTKRLIYLSLAGGVLVLVAGFAGWAFAVVAFTLVNLVLASLVVVDIVQTPKPEVFEVHRELNTKLSLGAENDVEIIVRNNSPIPLLVSVTDSVPEHFKHTLPMEAKWVPAHGQEIFKYQVTPMKRGEVCFENIYVRTLGIFGFIQRQTKIRSDEKYKVYPNMKALTDYRISALNMNMFLHGIKKTRRNVQGGEFDSLREYVQSDPYNIINWAATARRHELIVNTYVPEKNQYIFIMIDSSRVMNSEYKNIKKLDYAINSAFLLADYCTHGGDNVGLMVFDNKVRRYVAPRKNNFETIASNLYNVEYTETSADYDNAIKTFKLKQRRRTLVFIFTELFNVDEALRFANAVNTHLSNHLVYAITIKDPRVDDIANMDIEKLDDVYLKSAGVKLVGERDKIRAVLKKNGIMSSDVEPDKLSLEAVCRYLDIKRSGAL
ncbi:MAG TPA: DUF58 domain-containing protein [Clostridiaceae bacterium]|jgi:uncharacterized protein (DUF58 family)|nr:DUF58 domain-containing protein [Clostridiaceae bacterium]